MKVLSVLRQYIMKNNQLIKNSKGLVKAICGSLLIGLPAISLTSVAMPVNRLNPDLNLVSQVPSPASSTDTPAPTSITPPLPEQLQPPSATVTPVGGRVNVKLMNQTYTDITYQVIGDTVPRTLSGRSEVTLQNLRTPVHVTFQRPDRGFLQVNPQSNTAGMLEVSLTEATDFGTDKTAMTIQENGDVFLN